MADEKNETIGKNEDTATKTTMKTPDDSTKINMVSNDVNIDIERSRYPFCLVWTPMPILTWLIPFIGHIGIGTSTGVIRDFPFPYRVRENRMAFGKPCMYVQLSKDKAFNGDAGWDAAVTEASHIYKKKMHFVFFQNCYSHVSKALNLMQYDGCTTWNGFKLVKLMMTQGKFVSCAARIKTWVPLGIFIAAVIIIVALCLSVNSST